MPSWLGWIASVNPLTFAIEPIRLAYSDSFDLGSVLINAPYGDMNVARNMHLDGTAYKIVGVGMKNCAWRPLVGNGVNRDTSVYVGVQTLENSGIDRRVDLILTEGGMEWSIPESHALWS